MPNWNQLQLHELSMEGRTLLRNSWSRVMAGVSLGVLVAFGMLFAAACGDDDEAASTATPTRPTTETPGGTPTGSPGTPPPAPGTLTPTPEAGSREGFMQMLHTFDREMSGGALDPIIARLRWEEYTCKASDIEPGLGQPECKTAGEVIKAILVGNWRSEGGLRKVESVVARIQELQAAIEAGKTDRWGAGAPTVYAFDGEEHKAVVTAITKCMPQFQCPDGTMRISLVLSFEFAEGRWGMTKVLYALALAEEFLEPSGEARQIQMPNWERFE